MPVRGSDQFISESSEKRKAELLSRIKKVTSVPLPQIPPDHHQQEQEVIKGESLKVYKFIIDNTLDLPLEKLVLTPEGCDIFDELCMRLDVNQKYAEILPQWKDVAHHLQMDELTTKWVEVCVRPIEGLTRAMLEVYMRDGGTLGEVLEALLHLECLEILETMRPKLDKFIKMRDKGDIVPKESNEKFFSVLKTLFQALGNKDPCHDLQHFANGLKQMNNPAGLEHTVLVQHNSEVLLNGGLNSPDKEWPLYKSELHLKKLLDNEEVKLDHHPGGGGQKRKVACRILLLFSQDGVAASDAAVQISKRMEHDVSTSQLTI
jgi:hypothetical protein